MVKKIIAGSVLALALIGCGGSGGTSGDSSVFAVNALPNIGGVTITANGGVVLNNAGYGTNSGAIPVPVGSGTGASVFLTNSSNTQLASGTCTFTDGDYYTIYAMGSLTSQFLFVYTIDTTSPQPVNNQPAGRLILVNASITVPSVDIYATLSGNSQGAAALTSVTPFTPQSELELPDGTYDIQFKPAGSNASTPALVDFPSVIVTDPTTPATAIQELAIADAQSAVGAAVTQQAMPTIAIPIVTNSIKPRSTGHTLVIGHPNMVSFPKL